MPRKKYLSSGYPKDESKTLYPLELAEKARKKAAHAAYLKKRRELAASRAAKKPVKPTKPKTHWERAEGRAAPRREVAVGSTPGLRSLYKALGPKKKKKE